MEVPRPPRQLVEQFRGIPSSILNDTMNRMFGMNKRIRPMNKVPLLGSAITAKTPPNDNLFIHKAIDMALPGDVIVVDAGGASECGLMGELMLTYVQKRGVAGVILGGCIQDGAGVETLGLSVYAEGVTNCGPYKNGPGEINFPISCGDLVVCPGDILVGDSDGVVVIRVEEAEEILLLAKHQLEKESKKLAAYNSGNLDREAHASRIDSLLEKKGVIYY
jgi:regulator of RNase E activity RraA